uniref:FAD-dependent oxidoreductase n=1 Tax=Thermosporothrix sp. COM3 TaxID=2490863 RepID=A0A455SNI3_9CHLR|nr:FAD-dependent oxidoreductase [Thermosporothrix sp. COM3]
MHIPANRRILISGASITGPTLAYWLSRYGFQPTIVEQAPTLREGGYKVDIRGVAIDVIEWMGLLPAIRQASTQMKGGTYVDSRKRPVASIPADILNYREGRDDEVVRGDLSRILYEHTRDDVEYLFGDSITAIEQHEDGVQVSFRHAAPRTFDLVIGADGLHSNVRTLAFGDEAQFIRHLGAYVSIFSTPNFFQLDHHELYYPLPGKIVGSYSAHDTEDAKAFFYFMSPQLTYDYRDYQQQKQLLVEQFAGEGGIVPQLLEVVWDAPDFYFDSLSQIYMDYWSAGRVVLAGDAGYCASPASGQGTSLALVGAYVLAGELAEAHGDYRTAFARYEDVLRGYVTANQNLGAQGVGDSIPRTRIEIGLRTLMLRLLSLLPRQRSLVGKMSQATQQAANAIKLKHY